MNEDKTCQTCGNLRSGDGQCIKYRFGECLNHDKWQPKPNPMDNAVVQELRAQVAKLEAENIALSLAYFHGLGRWIPVSEQLPPEDESRYTARKFHGETYWAWLPEEPKDGEE